MKVLITGSAGFIGAHTVEHFLKETDWDIVGVDSLEHKGDMRRVTPFLCDRYEFIKADLADAAYYTIARLYDIKPDIIINMASESHVDRSIDTPVPFVMNNVELTLQMLEYAREVKPKMFIQISTDEVYGPMYDTPHPEWDTMLPSNPYSASKAAQEALAIAWWRTYNVPVVITNTMNNFGERQDTEKFVPMVIQKVLNGEVVPVHGTKEDIGSRFYLHARNHADALKFIIEHYIPKPFQNVKDLDRPIRVNIVGDEQVDNLTMAQKIADILGKPLKYELVDFHSSRPGHDPHYGLNGDEMYESGWSPPVDFDDALKRTVLWTLQNKEWL